MKKFFKILLLIFCTFITSEKLYAEEKKKWILVINIIFIPECLISVIKEKNLKLNKCSYKLYNKNLSVKDKKLKKNFYLSKDFLASSSRIKTKSSNIKK